MFRPATDWNPIQARLREMIRKPEHFAEAMALCQQLQGMVHLSDISVSVTATLADEVRRIPERYYRIMPTKRDVTIVWNLWHITRIEDATMNLLVDGGGQVLDEMWLEAIGTEVRDTGNAMTDPEILALSDSVDVGALWGYRSAVGARSREILAALTPGDMKRKFPRERVERIVEEGVLTAQPDSIWLRDFWGKKDVAGILLMPLTRHQAGHLGDCLKLGTKCAAKAPQL